MKTTAKKQKEFYLLISGNWKHIKIYGRSQWEHKDESFWIYDLKKAYLIEMGLEKLMHIKIT